MARLKKRADGRYQVQISLGTDPITGKRKCKTVYGSSPSEVMGKADDLRAKLGRGLIYLQLTKHFLPGAIAGLSQKMAACVRKHTKHSKIVPPP